MIYPLVLHNSIRICPALAAQWHPSRFQGVKDLQISWNTSISRTMSHSLTAGQAPRVRAVEIHESAMAPSKAAIAGHEAALLSPWRGPGGSSSQVQECTIKDDDERYRVPPIEHDRAPTRHTTPRRSSSRLCRRTSPTGCCFPWFGSASVKAALATLHIYIRREDWRS
jgi:hypothetical protein